MIKIENIVRQNLFKLFSSQFRETFENTLLYSRRQKAYCVFSFRQCESLRSTTTRGDREKDTVFYFVRRYKEYISIRCDSSLHSIRAQALERRPTREFIIIQGRSEKKVVFLGASAAGASAGKFSQISLNFLFNRNFSTISSRIFV